MHYPEHGGFFISIAEARLLRRDYKLKLSPAFPFSASDIVESFGKATFFFEILSKTGDLTV